MKDYSAHRLALLSGLFGGLGLVSTVACSSEVASTGAGGSGGSGSSTTGSTHAATTSSKSSSTSTGSAGGAGTTSASTTASTGTGVADVQRCFTPGLGVMCPAAADAAAVFGACTTAGEHVTAWISGPVVVGTDCCYQVDASLPGDPACGVVGRPFMQAGVARVAPLRRGGAGWASHGTRPPAPSELDERTRHAIAAEWARDGAFEHASVASFAKLSLELLAMGAPSELLERTHQAAIDEVRHARLGYELASLYFGHDVGPAKLREAAHAEVASNLAELAHAAVLEGCFGETVASLMAAAQRDAASRGRVRDALEIITVDEAKHAELSFEIVRWALTEGGDDVRSKVAEAIEMARADLGRAEQRARETPPVDAIAPETLLAHGRLPAMEALAIRSAVTHQVVIPALEALMRHA